MLLALTAALHPPVRSSLERTVKSYRRKNKRVPELRLAKGPLLEGATGDGAYSDLFGATWALALTRDGLKLARLGVSGWYEVAPLEPLPVVDSSARHIGLAFDQSARPVIAWENSGQVFVRQYDVLSGGYVIRGGFAGADPVLLMDAIANANSFNSDVLLGHLSVSRDEFILRAQRELYATPRVVSVPSAAILDAAVVDGHSVKFFGVSNNSAWSVVSELYPVILNDNLTTTTMTPPSSASYDPVVVIYSPTLDNLTTTTMTPPSSASYDLAVVIYSPTLDNLTTTTMTPPLSASYDLAVLVYNATQDNLTTVTMTAPNGGTYALA